MFFSFILFEFWVIIKLIAPQQMPPAPYEAGSLEEIVYLLQQFGDIKFEGLCVGLVRGCWHAAWCGAHNRCRPQL